MAKKTKQTKETYYSTTIAKHNKIVELLYQAEKRTIEDLKKEIKAREEYAESIKVYNSLP